MKKAIVSIAVGAQYQQLEACYGRFRADYAKSRGYEYVVVSDLDSSLPGETQKEKCSFKKLSLSRDLRGYDFVVVMDCDSLVNPEAPCLTQYFKDIPAGGFAAAGSYPHEKQAKLFPKYSASYYNELELNQHHRALITKDTLSIDDGLLLFKPQEVLKRWQELLEMRNELNAEQRLNLYEVQRNRCLILPPEWHIVWELHKAEHYSFLPKATAAPARRGMNIGTVLGEASTLERNLILLTLKQNYFVNFAFWRGNYDRLLKLSNFSPDQFQKDASQALKQLQAYR